MTLGLRCLVHFRQTVTGFACLSGFGSLFLAGRFDRPRGNANIGAFFSGPSSGVPKVHQTQAHRIAKAPQRQQAKQNTQNNPCKRHLQGAQTIRGQADNAIAPYTAKTRRQRPVRRLRESRKGCRGQQYTYNRGKDF